MEVQRGKCSEIDSEKSVSLALVSADKIPRIDLEEVSMSETIRGILVRALTKKLQMRNISGFDYTRVGEPELLALSIPSKKRGGNSSKITLSSEDQTQTLGEYLSAAGYFSSSSEGSSSEDDADSNSMLPIKLFLIPRWERTCLIKQMQKERDRDDDESGTDDESDDELDVGDVDSIVDKKRPEVLVENKKVLRVLGRLRVHFQDKNGIVKCHLVDYLGELRCEPKDVVKLTTPAKRVLLVFSDNSLECMERYFGYLDHDTTINRNDEVLILLVTWDKFSYWLLRMLRKSIGSEVPFIAFTDAHVHHLDLLTFLDTPPQKLLEHYGWNDCADLSVGLVDVVDIKWAGVRPSDDHSPSAGVVAISDYDKICDFLEQQGKWPVEMQYFRKFKFYKKRFSHIYIKYNIKYNKPEHYPFRFYIWKEYIPQKLVNKDWI